MGTIAKTDAQLVEASRRGELEAFGHLVERYQGVVCAVGYSATGDRVLGEDVAQDTFVAAWQQLDRVRDAMRIGPWLCGIARNLGRKARRRTHREQLGELDEQASIAPSAFDLLASRDAERVVRDALARVPDSYREVLVLYYREERSVHEVAGALGISEDAVMQRLTRGRRYLADSVTTLVERSLRDPRPRRDLVAAVLVAIAALAIPTHVDASPLKAKGSTMLKLALAASALAAAGVTAYVLHDHGAPPAPLPVSAAAPRLHFGPGPARAPSNGPTAKRHETAARHAAVDDLGWLPANADVVAGIDMTRIQTSALWQTFVAPLLEHASGIDAVVAACGFDPLASLTLVTVGVTGMGSDSQPAGTFVFHGFDKTKAMACVTSYAVPSTTAAGATVTVDGDVVIITPPNDPGSAIGLTFVDDGTALVVVGPAATTKAGIEQVAAGHGALASSPQFAELFADIDSDDPLWLVVAPTAPVFTDINNSLAPETAIRVQAAYGSVDVSNSLVVQAGVRLGSPDQVSQLVSLINTKVAQLTGNSGIAGFFDQLDVAADGNDVIIDVAANAAQLLELGGSLSTSVSATPAGADGPGTFTVGVNL